ncbi:MAG: transposase [Terracidiphilus sp.]
MRKDEAAEVEIDFLGLSNCVTLRQDQVEHILLVRALYIPPISTGCPGPDCKGRWERTKLMPMAPFADSPRDGRPVVVDLFVVQFVCSDCGHPLEFDIEWYHEARQMTRRLEKYVTDRAATLSTFRQIALDSCLDENTVGDICADAFRGFDLKRSKDLPRVLQIDEVYFHDKYYTILVNGETGEAVDLLEGRSDSDIRKRIKEAGNAEAVDYWCQDFSLQFHDVAVKPFPRPEKRKSKSPKVFEAEQTEYPTSYMLAFEPMPEGDVDELSEEESYRQTREKLAALLTNAKAVGDHFHLNKAIGDSLNKIRVYIQNSLPEYYFNLETSSCTETEKSSPEWERIKAQAREKADRLAKDRKDELTNNRYKLFARRNELNDDDRFWVDRMCSEHPLLGMGWEAKNRGLDVFPVKPPLGRTKKSREAAMAKRAALLMDEQEAGRKLDEWAASIPEELRPFFGRPLRLIGTWREEIIRIGTTGYSNAGAESKNRYLRMLMAITHGLDFDALRARLLWADDHRRTDRWPSFCDDEEGMISMAKFVELAKAVIARNEEERTEPSTAS